MISDDPVLVEECPECYFVWWGKVDSLSDPLERLATTGLIWGKERKNMVSSYSCNAVQVGVNVRGDTHRHRKGVLALMEVRWMRGESSPVGQLRRTLSNSHRENPRTTGETGSSNEESGKKDPDHPLTKSIPTSTYYCMGQAEWPYEIRVHVRSKYYFCSLEFVRSLRIVYSLQLSSTNTYAIVEPAPLPQLGPVGLTPKAGSGFGEGGLGGASSEPAKFFIFNQPEPRPAKGVLDVSGAGATVTFDRITPDRFFPFLPPKDPSTMTGVAGTSSGTCGELVPLDGVAVGSLSFRPYKGSGIEGSVVTRAEGG